MFTMNPLGAQRTISQNKSPKGSLRSEVISDLLPYFLSHLLPQGKSQKLEFLFPQGRS